MTAIQKMVVILEKDLAEARYTDIRIILRGYIDEARRLAAEEAKEKPTAPSSLDSVDMVKCKYCAEGLREKHKIVTKNVISLRELHREKLKAYYKSEGKPIDSIEFKQFFKASSIYDEAVRKDPFMAYMLDLIAYKKKHNGCYVILGEVLGEYLHSRYRPASQTDLVGELKDWLDREAETYLKMENESREAGYDFGVKLNGIRGIYCGVVKHKITEIIRKFEGGEKCHKN